MVNLKGRINAVIASISSLIRSVEGFTAEIAGGFYFYIFAILIYFASSLAWGLRWWLILRRLGDRVSYIDTYTAIMGGILFNNITPSLKIGGEGFRAAWVWLTDRVPLDRTFLSIFYERLTEVPGVVLIGVIAVSAGLLNIVHASGFSLLLLLLPFSSLSLGWLRDLWRDTVERIRKDSRILIRDWKLTTIAVVIGIAIWLQDFTRFYLIGRAVGIRLSIGEAAILSISYLVLGMGPTPAGLGFVEGGLTSILVAMGYPLDRAGLLIIGERIISSVLSSIVGFVLVLLRGGTKMFKEASRIARSIKGGAKLNGEAEDSTSIRLV